MHGQCVVQVQYFLQGPLGVAVSEVPLDAGQALLQRFSPGRIDLRHAQRVLLQHRQAHGQVKPVQDARGLRTQVTGQRPQHRGAVREEFHRLIGLQPLRTQDLKYAPARLGIDLLHEAEAFGITFCRNTFARNHLETAFFMSVPDVAAVEADHQRAGRARQGF